MLLIKTKIGPSSVHGIGLFAAEFVPKGTKTWQYEPLFDTAFTEAEIAMLPPCARHTFYQYAYFDADLNKFVLCFDDLRFINHTSEDANILSTTRFDVAARDIMEGEELFCNYNHFEEGYFKRRGIDESTFTQLNRQHV